MDDDPPDYEKAFRYFSYAFTGQFYNPFGLFAELFENKDREALMPELRQMKEKAVNQFNLNI